MVLVAHGELVAVGVAMSGSDVAEVDDERAVALKDTLLVGVCKDRSQCGAQLSVLDKVIVEEVDVDAVFLCFGVEKV